MRFADIPGHEDVKGRLRRMADSRRIPHAIVLEGPDGCGKFALARAFAQYIHCQNRTPERDSCGECPSCRQHQSFNHIDTLYSFPVIKKKSKPTVSDDYMSEFVEFMQKSPFMDFEQWMEQLGNPSSQPAMFVEEGQELSRKLGFMTRRSDYKIVLMWLPERMRDDTANKLLKLVEEPSGDAIILMASSNSRQILPTIYSRTQRIPVLRYSDGELASALMSDGYPPNVAAELARVAQGNVNEAHRLGGASEERKKRFELFTRLMRAAYARKVVELRKWSLDVAQLGREGSIQFVDYCSRLLRESFLMHLGDGRLQSMDDAEQQFMARFFPFINERNVLDFCTLMDEARRDVAANGNAKMVFFDLAVRSIILIRR